MRFTLSWLKEHLCTSATPREISEILLSLGHENEVSSKFQHLNSFKAAKVLEVNPHPNADRLKLCKVQSHDKVLDIVCGAPNVRPGIYVALSEVGQVIPSNNMEIKSSKIRGQLSQGMICSGAELEISSEADCIMELTQNAEIGKPFFHFLQQVKDEPLFSLTITPNRGDCLGVRGIARDLAVKEVGSLIPLEQVLESRSLHKQFEEIGTANLDVRVQDPVSCSRFSYRVIHGVGNGSSPYWLRERMRISKKRSINSIVDATNFFLYDLNRPFHAFNLRSLKGDLFIEKAKGGEVFKGLDEKTYSVPAGALVIRDKENVVSLAGVMGALHTGTYEDTKDILLESAYFNPVDIAFSGQKLAIRTDSRARFERGIDREFCGLNAVTQMILNLCGGQPTSINAQGNHYKRKIINLSKHQVKKVAGIEVEPRKILNKLGFENKEGDNDFSVPSWRHDCHHTNDLVEELARVVGYSHIPSVSMKKSDNSPPQFLGIEEICRRVSVQRGMWESMTYCFVHEEQSRFYGEENPVLLLNPMHSDMNALRPSILPSLVASLEQNFAFNCGELNLFEVGTLYKRSPDIQEKRCIAGLRFGGKTQNWEGTHQQANPFHVKHDVLALAKAVGMSNYEIQDTAPNWYENGQSLLLNGNNVGYFGQINLKLTRGLPIMAFEVFLDKLNCLKRVDFKRYQPHHFQPVVRDFAFLVRSEVTAEQVLKAVRVNEEIANFVLHADIFDLYKVEKLGFEYKSIGIRVHILDREKNFTQNEINEISSGIEKSVCTSTGAKVRE